MPDLCKLMTSTFILFRSPSLLYQTANFLNWRLFKTQTAVTLLLVTLQATSVMAGCYTSGYRVDQWATQKLIDFRKKENALGVQYGYRTCVCEHWKNNWIHHWSMYNWTYREGLKLLVGVWINHLYIQQHIKKTKKRKLRESLTECFLIQGSVISWFMNMFSK